MCYVKQAVSFQVSRGVKVYELSELGELLAEMWREYAAKNPPPGSVKHLDPSKAVRTNRSK